jgi:putative membrane protein
MLNNILQGLLIGVALVLPGLSAGTVILIFGFYRRFLDDLATLNIRPYLLHLIGALAGGLAAVYTVSYLLENHNLLILAFIFGMLIASVPVVLDLKRGLGLLKPLPLLCGACGFYLAWFVICEPNQTFTVLPPGGFFHFFIGGALASATMMLPGVSGSAVLIIINLYDDVINAVRHWEWLKLSFLAVGFLVGILGLARLLSALYRRYQLEISFLLAGLIAGSTRALLPLRFSFTFFLAALFGAALVYLLTRMRRTVTS